MGQSLERLVSPVWSFLPLLFRLNSHLECEAHHVYLLALASKTHARGSPTRGTLHYSNGHQWPNVDGANLLSRSFISSPCKPSYSASFLHSFSYYSFLISLISLNK